MDSNQETLVERTAKERELQIVGLMIHFMKVVTAVASKLPPEQFLSLRDDFEKLRSDLRVVLDAYKPDDEVDQEAGPT